jgi:hypothetical protein
MTIQEELEYRKTVPIKFGANFMPDGMPFKDLRTIPFRAMLNLENLPPLQSYYNVDESLQGINDSEMFGNDQYGDCVKAMMAHGILRLEKYECGKQPIILATEVIKEYLRETGNRDIGLIMLNALKDWRNHGLSFGGKTYTIDAFSSVDVQDLTQVRYCIQLFGGIFFAMRVYTTDIDQFRAGEVWHLTGKDGILEGSHGVYGYMFNMGQPSQKITLSQGCRVVNIIPPLYGYLNMASGIQELFYADDIFEQMTWGVRQKMTTDFWKNRVMEAYGIIDQIDNWVSGNSVLNIPQLRAWLEQVTGHPNTSSNICFISKVIKKLF